MGRHLVEAALARGDEVTLFNRGNTPLADSKVELLRGDREKDLSLLEGRAWDVAIDTCGYLPNVVRRSAELLYEAIAHYTFVSTISVYPDGGPSHDEGSPVRTLTREQSRQAESLPKSKSRAGRDFGDLYGPLKAECENAAVSGMRGRALVVRPGVIIGPHDTSDRFTYWVRRVARAGEVLAPQPKNRRVQLIDARDLAAWILSMAEARCIGTYNAVGPRAPMSMGELLATAKDRMDGDSTFTWVDGDFLAKHEVELPLWIPNTDDAIDGSKAFAAGLCLRPVHETIDDTLAWDRSRPQASLETGLSEEREASLLRAWRDPTASEEART